MNRQFHSHSRSLALRGQEAARGWRTIIDNSIVLAATARRGAAIDRFELTEFVKLVVRLQKTPFPLDFASASAASTAFLKLASAFAVAGRAEDREVLGDFLVEGARCLDRLLINQAQAHMARITGEHD